MIDIEGLTIRVHGDWSSPHAAFAEEIAEQITAILLGWA